MRSVTRRVRRQRPRASRVGATGIFPARERMADIGRQRPRAGCAANRAPPSEERFGPAPAVQLSARRRTEVQQYSSPLASVQ
eukprot:1577766-Pyramimonas_sp.AAC.2